MTAHAWHRAAPEAQALLREGVTQMKAQGATSRLGVLLAGVERLAPAQRELFRILFQQGATVAVACAQLGITRGDLESQRSEMLRALFTRT